MTNNNIIYPALFLDRDGVINYNYGFVHIIQKFDFMPHIFELVKVANNAGFKVVVVTNQSGIARGYYSEACFERLNNWMLSQFKEHDCWIDDVLYCPHHPEYGAEPYKQNCSCRKPKPGMALRAASKHNIDLFKSFMVGDSVRDLEFALTAGMKRAFYLKSTSEISDHEHSIIKDERISMVDSLNSVVTFVKNLKPKT